jgi:NAD(P)-dependent dehydrogenase (short-subunit alcohol dehydrogenase family)
MVVGNLVGRRVVVVGASAGIGRSFAEAALADGAQVIVCARRADKLTELVAAATHGTALSVDISKAEDCARLADTARAELGAIDLVFHAAGSAPLKKMADMTAEDWQFVMGVNVVGVHQVIAALLPVLAPAAIVSVLSSETVGQPRAGLGAYSSSKAALEDQLRSWHNENPGIRFSCVAVGSTMPTEFGSTFDMELLTEVMNDWALRGLMQTAFMQTDDVARVLLDTYAASLPYPEVNFEHVLLRSPSAVVGSAAFAIEQAESTIPS